MPGSSEWTNTPNNKTAERQLFETLGATITEHRTSADAIAALSPETDAGSIVRRRMTVFWDTLRPIAGAHAESLVVARHNCYLWDQALSPVCLVDLDLLAFALAGLRMGGSWRLPAPNVPEELKTVVDATAGAPAASGAAPLLPLLDYDRAPTADDSASKAIAMATLAFALVDRGPARSHAGVGRGAHRLARAEVVK